MSNVNSDNKNSVEPAPAAAALIAGASTFPGAAVCIDPMGRIRDANLAAAAMLGFEPQQLMGRSLCDLALDGWQAAAEVAAARVRFGAIESFELALKGRSGRRTLVEMTARADSHQGAEGAVLAWSERRVRRSIAGAQAGETDVPRVAYKLLRTQEAERQRVSSELNDEIAPVITMIKYMVEDAIGRMGEEPLPEAKAILSEATMRLRDVLGELRRIATGLRPKLLDDLGLLPTLEWNCRVMEDASSDLKINCRLSVSEADVPDALKLEIFRIVQEALNNVTQHANARQAQVMLYRARGELCVLIEDDGSGFDLQLASADSDGASGIGLPSIRKRIEATGGRLLWETAANGGTRIGAAWRIDTAAARHKPALSTGG